MRTASRQLVALAAVVCVEAFVPAALDAKSRPSYASAQMCTMSNFAPLGLRRSLPPRVKSLLNLLHIHEHGNDSTESFAAFMSMETPALSTVVNWAFIVCHGSAHRKL